MMSDVRRAAPHLAIAAAACIAGGCGGASGVSWQDAYRALGVVESGDERVILATAMAESDPPVGWTPGPRLHRAGTVAWLRYETFDADARPIDHWEVRALVPPLPWIENSVGEKAPLLSRDGCPAECQAEVERGATLLRRSGDPGLGAEWVRRMPLNQTLELGSRSLVTHDLLDDAPRRLPIRFVHGGRTIADPANIRVTLFAVCAARVRVGSVSHMEFHSDAVVAIPRGLRTMRWVQLDGCGPLE